MQEFRIAHANDLSLDELAAQGLLFRQLRKLFHREKCSRNAHDLILHSPGRELLDTPILDLGS